VRWFPRSAPIPTRVKTRIVDSSKTPFTEWSAFRHENLVNALRRARSGSRKGAPCPRTGRHPTRAAGSDRSNNLCGQHRRSAIVDGDCTFLDNATNGSCVKSTK
jgi:hypothetical protein